MRKFIRTILIVFIVLGIAFIKIKSFSKQKPLATSLKSDYMDLGNISSKAAIVVERSKGHILMGKNFEEKIHPASMTKVMTGIVVLENSKNLKDTVEITSDVVDYCLANGLSTSGFEVGDNPRVIDLLYGLLLESGGESGITLAKYISGNEEEFSKLMNEKAAELGMYNSHFTNSTGMTDTENFSTPKDMAILFDFALKNKDFKKIVIAKDHKVPSSNSYSQDHIIENYLFIKRDNLNIPEDYIQCAKTGYTQAAGLCLVSSGTINNKEYILVTAGADGSGYTEQFNLLDTKEIYQQLENLE